MSQVPSDSIAGRVSAMRPALVCSWADGGWDAAWVHLGGVVDFATVPQLKQTLEQFQSEARLVVLDLRDLEFIDDSGVHAIVMASSRARQSAGRLVILRGTPSVDRVFALSKSSEQLEIADLGWPESPIAAVVQLAQQDRAS